MPNFLERTGYVGVLPLLFAVCALFIRRCRWTIFYGAATLLCLLAAYGVPPFPQLFAALPVMKDIDPMRLIMIAGFSLAVLAGFGWDAFLRLENRRKIIGIVAGFWAVIGLILLWYWHWIEPRWKHLDADHRSFLEPQFLFMLGNLAASGALLLPSIARQWKLARLIGLGWIAADLLVFGIGINPTIARDAYYPGTPAIDWLQQDKSDFRILGKQMVLTPNTPELFGLKDARGYDFATVKRYEELVEGQATNFFFYRAANTLPAAFPLLGVKYVLTFNEPAPDPASFDFVYSNVISIYRNRQFQGRVLTVFNYSVEPDSDALAQVRSGTFDPRSTLLLAEKPTMNDTNYPAAAVQAPWKADIVSETPDEVTVETSLLHPGFLLLLDTYIPGWKATVNGVATPILRADYTFRAVAVPAGKSTVRFVYEPMSFRVGMLFLFIALTVLALAFFWSFRPKRRINTPAG
jgi:hypothetical protein